MKQKNMPKLLFFTAASAPTKNETAAAETLSTRFKVCIRNAGAAAGSIESAQAVAGAVPAAYAERYPGADEYTPDKEPALGSIYQNVMGHTVERIRSAGDGSPIERTLFTPPPAGTTAPRIRGVAPVWKPNV